MVTVEGSFGVGEPGPAQHNRAGTLLVVDCRTPGSPPAPAASGWQGEENRQLQPAWNLRDSALVR